MLFRALLRHPSFAPVTTGSRRAPNLYESQIIRRLATSFNWNEENPRQLLRFMMENRAEYQSFLDETRTMRLSTLLTAPLAAPLRGRVPTALWHKQQLHLVVRSYFAHAWDARGCGRLVDKSPRNVVHIDKLKLVSPRSRMLFVSRHPLDTFASYRARARRDPGAKWADISPGRFIRIYRGGVMGALREAAKPDSSLLVTRYEDFTRDPAEGFRRICAFVGEPYLESCLDGEQGARPKPVASDLLYGPISANESKWPRDVDEVSARRLEDSLSPVMEAAGYRRYT